MNKNRRVSEDLSQAYFTWARSAYCLKIKPSQTGGFSEVTLIAFSVGAALGLREMFAAAARNMSWQEIMEDPYCLLNIVFEGLYARIDTMAWDFATVYGQEDDVSNRKTQIVEVNTYFSARKFSGWRDSRDMLPMVWISLVYICWRGMKYIC